MAEWNSWQEMNRLRHDIDRAFEQVGWRNGGRSGRTFPTAFLPGHAARAYPLVNVSEDANALYVTALAPGLDPTCHPAYRAGQPLDHCGREAACRRRDSTRSLPPE